MPYCNQCQEEWPQRKKEGIPVQCPRCKRNDWNGPKKWTLRAMAFAHTTIQSVVKKGTLVKQPCERCGDLNVEAHHENYDRPLDVRWLCKKHHVARHGEIGRPLVSYTSDGNEDSRKPKIFACLACKREWCYRGVGRPKRCGKCKSPYWDKERVYAI